MTMWNSQTHHTFQSERDERELDALHRIAQVLSLQSGQRQVLLDVLRVLEHDLTMARGTIMLVSPDGEELVVEAAAGLRSSVQHDARYRRGEGIVGRVMASGEPAVIPNISDEPDFLDRIHRRMESQEGDLSFICVPISLGNNVLGTLSADLPFRSGHWLHAALRVLQIVAAMIANDVNARRSAAAERLAFETENLRLRSALGEQLRPENLAGNSPAMKAVYQRIHQAAATDGPVLLRGESGVGKETAACAIHYGGFRAKGPFIPVNCGGMPAEAVENALFGQEGLVARAAGGTLYVSEVLGLPSAAQARLAELVRQSDAECPPDGVRVISATAGDLEQAMTAGLFRHDLYERMASCQIVLPPLRDRREDVLLLADHFSGKFARKLNRPISRISTTAIDMLMAYHWPGNVRELENCIEYAVLMTTDGVIHGYCLPPTLQMPGLDEAPEQGTLKARIRLLEKDMVTDALKRYHGNVTAAARELGITPRMVRYKMQSLKLPKLDQFRGGA